MATLTVLRHRGISYLAQHGIDVLTLQGHSTHVGQPFYVAIAAAIKMRMSKELEAWNRKLQQGIIVAQSGVATKRVVLVSAYLDAFDEVATKRLCRTVSARSGLTLSSPRILFDHPDDWISSSFFRLRQATSSRVLSRIRICHGNGYSATAEGLRK